MPLLGVPIYHNVAWAEAYFHTKWHLGHSRNGPRIGRAVYSLFWGGELGPHLAQCGLD